MNQEERLEKIIEEQLEKYSAYSSEKGHKVINVTPRGASIDIARAILKEYVHKDETFATVEQIEKSGYIHRDDVVERLEKINSLDNITPRSDLDNLIKDLTTKE